MFESLTWLTGIVITGASVWAYLNTRDSLHPLMYLGPLFLYMFVFRPLTLYYQGHLEVLFPSMDQLEFVQTLTLAGVSLFCLGSLSFRGFAPGKKMISFREGLPREARLLLYRLGLIFGAIAVGAYFYMVMEGGGLINVYSVAKAHLSGGSGYIGEAPLLAYPAIILLYLAWQGRPLTIGKILILLIIASPHVLHGILGARRGPTFLIFITLFFGRYLTATKRVPFRTAFTVLAAVCILVLTLVTYRAEIHIGSDFETEEAGLMETLIPSEPNSGDEYVYAAGQILVSAEYDAHYWGRRYFATAFVRPIPSQIWPNKYEDVGVGWLEGQADMAGITDMQWEDTVGWVPLRGSSAGLVSDLFLEFSYFGLLFCYLLGWFYAFLWGRSRAFGGVWIILYLFAIILSVYIPTQGIATAWGFRFLFMAIPTLLFWKYMITPRLETTTLAQHPPLKHS